MECSLLRKMLLHVTIEISFAAESRSADLAGPDPGLVWGGSRAGGVRAGRRGSDNGGVDEMLFHVGIQGRAGGEGGWGWAVWVQADVPLLCFLPYARSE